MHPDRDRRPRQGFTLIEVMVVVVILAILAALIVPKIMGRPDEARVVAARQDISTIMQALRLYRLDNLRYPATEQGLMALVAPPTIAPMPPIAPIMSVMLSHSGLSSAGTSACIPARGASVPRA